MENDDFLSGCQTVVPRPEAAVSPIICQYSRIAGPSPDLPYLTLGVHLTRPPGEPGLG